MVVSPGVCFRISSRRSSVENRSITNPNVGLLFALKDSGPLIRSTSSCRRMSAFVSVGYSNVLTRRCPQTEETQPSHNSWIPGRRSEEHTSELQSRQYLVC